MIELNQIDTTRVRNVLNGKCNKRGCGLTTARLVQLFSYARPENDGKHYLFIGENQDNVHYLYKQFYWWLTDSGMYVDMNIGNKKYTVEFSQPPRVGLWQQLVAFFSKPYKSPKIQFDFTSAGIVDTRARRYNKIILDVTSQKYSDNYERIRNAFRAEINE